MKVTLNFLAVLISTLVLLSILAAGVVYQKYVNTSVSPAQTTPTHSRDEVISGIAIFLKNAQGPDASFPFRYRCELNRCTPTASQQESPIGWSILGLLAGNTVTGDPELQTAANLSIARVLRLCENDPRICASNFYALTHYYDTTNDQRYVKAIDSAAEYTRKTVAEWPGDFILQPEMNVYAKLEKSYEYYQDTNDRDAIISAAKIALQQWPRGFLEGPLFLYAENDYGVGYHMSYVVGGIFLPAYRVSGDERYLNAAREFFSKTTIDQHLIEFNWEGGMVALLYAVEALLSLSDMDQIPDTERYAYIATAQNIMRQIVEFQYDSPEQPVMDGTHGLRTGRWSENELPGVNYKNLNLNGRIALILTNKHFADMDFTLFYDR